ncbi:MAG: DUF6901 family protein [Opitutaceae bacterium]
MDKDSVGYHFKLENREVNFEVETQPRKLSDEGEHPDWARLGFNQCACCPLKESDCKYCPVAIRINEVMEAFGSSESIERVEVTVRTPERSYFEECDLQSGLNSLMGLLMATSGCPVLKELSSMANFHIPFCSTRQTLQRTVGSYLIKQYFKQLDGEEADWDLVHLKELYDVLEGLNQDFSRRVQASVSSDAISNAVIMFFATSVVVASSLEQQLKKHQSYLTNQDD